MYTFRKAYFCLSVVVLSSMLTAAAVAQDFTTLVSFNDANGQAPNGLVQGLDGNLYGTTQAGGAFYCNLGSGQGCGTIFNVSSDGTLTTIYNFDGSNANGEFPVGTPALGNDGNFYGATFEPTKFYEITPSGVFNALLNAYPEARGPVIQTPDGSFYGSSEEGATGFGSVYRVQVRGGVTRLTSLYNFCSQPLCTDGLEPYYGVIQGTDGNFYGTTYNGGDGTCYDGSLCGTVFKLTPDGTLTTLHEFCGPNCEDGAYPGPLVEANNGKFYGVTGAGGNQNCQGDAGDGCGTIFEVASDGTFKTVYRFCSRTHCTDGAYPFAGLVQGNDGNLYGISENSTGGVQILFSITLAGKLTVIARGVTGFDGAGSMIQSTDGNFYATATAGGDSSCLYGCGGILKVSAGLPPFIATQPAFGTVGSPVTILGNNLTSSTSVAFNGVAANFTIVSDTEITTTVPAGATTGSVQVTTPSGTLTSNVVFRVRP
jgi:uncharacterized repeat protein (TIGR03803 family)